jgi:2'-5' RNA ligase
VVQSVELLLDARSEALVRAQWRRLADAGLPGQAGHTAASNRPHVTLGVAAAIDADAERLLEPLAAALPLPCPLGPVAAFRHGARAVLVREVDAGHDLLALQARVAALLADCPGVPDTVRPDRWRPHVTLARRFPADRIEDAVRLLDATAVPGEAVALRRWDGAVRREWRLGSAG